MRTEHGIEIEAYADAVQLAQIEMLPSLNDDGSDRRQELSVPCFPTTGAMKRQ